MAKFLKANKKIALAVGVSLFALATGLVAWMQRKRFIR